MGLSGPYHPKTEVSVKNTTFSTKIRKNILEKYPRNFLLRFAEANFSLSDSLRLTLSISCFMACGNLLGRTHAQKTGNLPENSIFAGQKINFVYFFFRNRIPHLKTLRKVLITFLNK